MPIQLLLPHTSGSEKEESATRGCSERARARSHCRDPQPNSYRASRRRKNRQRQTLRPFCSSLSRATRINFVSTTVQSGSGECRRASEVAARSGCAVGDRVGQIDGPIHGRWFNRPCVPSHAVNGNPDHGRSTHRFSGSDSNNSWIVSGRSSARSIDVRHWRETFRSRLRFCLAVVLMIFGRIDRWLGTLLLAAYVGYVVASIPIA